MKAVDGMNYDVVVIGSGFGGSVAALRLVEKGYTVAVLEAGKRWQDKDFPKTSWRLRKFLWAPALGFHGIQRITLLRGDQKGAGVLVLAGAGVGGGSLNYANTLYRPLDPFYQDPQWRDIADWKAELAPHYDTAERMLGVVTYDRVTAADEVVRKVADRMGVGHTFHKTKVGVFLGMPGKEVPDPFFGGEGPARTGCIHCGECMTGCRHGAKNTLVKNYLYLAERKGAKVFPRTTVTEVKPVDGGGYLVNNTFRAEHVVFAAGTLGTQKLLHAMKAKGHLPEVSDRLGVLTRTNSESLLGATVAGRKARQRGLDFTDGVAITSSFHPNEHTHIEPVHYGKGSNSMGLLQSPPLGGQSSLGTRLWSGFKALFTWPFTYLRLMSVRRWSQRTIIALVMQAHDNSLTVRYRKGKLRAVLGHGAPNPTFIPEGQEAVRLLAEEIQGVPGGTMTELFDIPMTAHILGGAVIGESPETGVIDKYHRVFGHKNLHVVDGAAVSANLGVNPSLTITAQAERAFSFWPGKGDPDTRPVP
jgi:cholesterol oxidase